MPNLTDANCMSWPVIIFVRLKLSVIDGQFGI